MIEDNVRHQIIQCISQQGTGQACKMCLLKSGKSCHIAEQLGNLLGNLRKKDPMLLEEGHLDILSDTLHGVLKALNSGKRILNINAFTSHIFKLRRIDYYKKLPRFTAFSSVKLNFTPENLSFLIDKYPENLKFDNKELNVAPRLPKTVKLLLLSLSGRSDWQRIIENLYKNSWKAEIVPLPEDWALPVSPVEVNSSKKMNKILPKRYVNIFSKIPGKQAENCMKLYTKYGTLIFDEDTDRSVIAKEIGKKENTLNKNISRCKQIFQNIIISLLEEVGNKNAKFCMKLLRKVFGMGNRDSANLTERIECLSKELGLSKKKLNNQIRHCRKMAMAEALR